MAKKKKKKDRKKIRKLDKKALEILSTPFLTSDLYDKRLQALNEVMAEYRKPLDQSIRESIAIMEAHKATKH